jgi:hypothetical protein
MKQESSQIILRAFSRIKKSIKYQLRSKLVHLQLNRSEEEHFCQLKDGVVFSQFRTGARILSERARSLLYWPDSHQLETKSTGAFLILRSSTASSRVKEISHQIRLV